MRNLEYLEKKLIYLGESGLVDHECALCQKLVDTTHLIQSLNLPRNTIHLPGSTLTDAETTL